MLDPLKKLPGYALRRASSAMLSDLARRLTPLALRPTEASILLLIASNPGITQSALCRTLDIQRANMTPITARLEQRALLARERVNGRSQGLILTADGATLLCEVRNVINAHEQSLLAHVPLEHRAHLLPALMALWDDETVIASDTAAR
jgi:DNA-binding MarR family transcriptional regulator